MIAATPRPPYYAVIFSSLRRTPDGAGSGDGDAAGPTRDGGEGEVGSEGRHNAGADDGYGPVAERMVALAAAQPGFLGVESVREGLGITVSYWQSLEAIAAWRAHAEHTLARERGRRDWYGAFKVRVCRVERDYGSGDPAASL